jgi:hypothetical protein
VAIVVVADVVVIVVNVVLVVAVDVTDYIMIVFLKHELPDLC